MLITTINSTCFFEIVRLKRDKRPGRCCGLLNFFSRDVLSIQRPCIHRALHVINQVFIQGSFFSLTDLTDKCFVMYISLN